MTISKGKHPAQTQLFKSIETQNSVKSSDRIPRGPNGRPTPNIPLICGQYWRIRRRNYVQILAGVYVSTKLKARIRDRDTLGPVLEYVCCAFWVGMAKIVL